MQSFLYKKGECMGLKSQLLGSIMSVRKLSPRSIARLALCSCPLVRTSLLTTPSKRMHSRRTRKTMQGECRNHACIAMAEPQGFL